jgi:hypothetical protein
VWEEEDDDEEDDGSGGGGGGPGLAVRGLGAALLLVLLPVDTGNPTADVTDCGGRGGGGGGGKDGVEGAGCIGALRSSITRNRYPCHS